MRHPAHLRGQPTRGRVGRFGLLCAVVGLTGCTLGPDPERPESAATQVSRFVNGPTPQPATQPATQSEAPPKPPEVDHWWRAFGDPVTNRLVQRALAHNTDLRQAAARVMEARAALGVATGQRWPQVDSGFSRNRTQSTFDFGDGRQSVIRTTYTLDANVSWQADLFGRLRRQQDAAEYRLLASRANRAGVLHTVVSEVVRLRTQIASLQQQLQIARNRTQSFQQTYELIQQRAKQELTNALEVRTAKENLAQSRAQIPGLRYQLRSARYALDVLLGRPPATGPKLAETLPALPPEPVPSTGVPAGLLDRRPDLRNTALRARAEQAEIGVAIARLYPDLTLSASGGYQSSELEDLIDHNGQIWSLLMDVAMPIFQGGAGGANINQARAQARAVAAAYAGEVLDAMREVEEALTRTQTTRQRVEHLKQQVQQARRSAELAQQRYDQGLINLLDVLEIQRRRFEAETALVQARQTLWEARVNLYLALGGDWVDPAARQPATQPATRPADRSNASLDPAERTARVERP